MADETDTDAATINDRLRVLCEETYGLVRQVSSGIQRLAVRAGDCSVEIEWDPGAAAAAGPTTVVTATAEATEQEGTAGQYVVTAPLVGTFYRSPEPGAKPFAEEGGIVEAGQDVAIVEAMKMMNRIQTEQGGRVVRILVEDGELVEFGQELMVIEPYDGG